MNAEAAKSSDEQFLEEAVLATLALELETPPPVARPPLRSRVKAWLSRVIGGSK